MGELHVRKRLRNVDPVSLKGDAPITIGRSSTNRIVLPSNAVSRRHCVIELAEDRARIRDLGSRAGTLVNGEKVDKAWLAHRDVIMIGRFELVYDDPTAVRDEPAPIDVPDDGPGAVDLEATRAELEAMRTELTSRRGEVESMRADLDARAATLAERERAADARAAELDAARADPAPPGPDPERAARLAADAASLQERNEAVAQREQAAATLDATLEAARQELDQQRTALAADAEARLEAQEETLALREEEIAAERAAVAESQRQIDVERQEWEARQHEAETTHAAATAALAARQAELEQRERALTAEREALEARARATAAEAAELGSRLEAAEATRTESEERAAAAERGREEILPQVETLRAQQDATVAELAAMKSHASSQGESIRRLDAERKALLEERSQMAIAITTLRSAIATVVQAAQRLQATRHRVRALETRWIDTDEAMNAVDAAGVSPDDDLLARHATLATDLEEAHEEREEATNALEATLANLARTAGPIEPPRPWRGLPADAGTADAKGPFGWLKRGRAGN